MNYFSIIYNILLFPVFYIFARIYKIFNNKFKERETQSYLHLAEIRKLKKSKKRIWFHAASMGEFEQAKPVIEKVRSSYDCEIIVTFFSPSGYENQKKYQFADYVFYLPLDTVFNAKNFVEGLDPDLAIFIRYEIWHNYLTMLNIDKIPIFLISATKPSTKAWNYPFLSSFYKHNLELFTAIYTAGMDHFSHYKSLNLQTAIIPLYDTRYDQILNKVEKFKVERKTDSNIIVLGSSWEEDEILFKNVDSYYQLIIVPHEPTEEHIKKTLELFPNSKLFSELNNDISNINNGVVIVDSIGKLLKIYSIADIAYVGGAFGAGLHSVSEPAGYGIPIVTGTNIERSIDAKHLFENGSLFKIDDENSLNNILDELKNKDKRKELGLANKSFIEKRSGSSKKISKDIIEILNS